MLKEYKVQSNHPIHPFFNISEYPPSIMIIKLIVTAVVAIVTIIEDPHKNLAIRFVSILVQILAQDIIITRTIFSEQFPIL